MNIVAHVLWAQDNDTYMFSGEDAPTTCDLCGYRLDARATNPRYKLRASKTDYSITYDGQDIVSKRFRDFCQAEGYGGVRFIPFESDENHFHFLVEREIPFDSMTRRTVFEKQCVKCGNFESIVGATPSYLLVQSDLKDGFYRTDLSFGSGDEKRPLVLVGLETKAKLQAANLRGLEFKPAYGIG